ncbi:MAG: Flp family type IVb pilin [Alphaproteobacteria bacterium]|nr:Flp family type IVb pilin [Alphaproteobacteria bacterium]
MSKKITRAVDSEQGVAPLEYGLVATLIAMVCVTVLANFG